MLQDDSYLKTIGDAIGEAVFRNAYPGVELPVGPLKADGSF